MMYYILYATMLIGFSGLAMQGATFKERTLGVLLTLANAIIFWR